MAGSGSIHVRVDDRLIHGQVVTTWVRSLGVKTIWVVSDRAANEPIEIILLKSSVPSHLTLQVYSVGEAIQAWQAPSSATILMLAETVQDVVPLVEAGLPIETIDLGGMRYHAGYVALSKAVYVGAAETAALEALRNHQVAAWIRVVPSDTKVDAYERLKQRWQES